MKANFHPFLFFWPYPLNSTHISQDICVFSIYTPYYFKARLLIYY